MNVRNRGVMAAVALATALGVTACGSNASSSQTSRDAKSGAGDSSLKLAYANITNKNPGFKLSADAFQAGGKKIGDSVSLYDNEADPSTAVTVANTMVTNAPDVAIDFPPAPAVGASLSAIFKRAKLKCIAVDMAIPSCPLFAISNESMGTGVGEELATLMKAKGWTGANTTFIIGQNSVAGDDNNILERTAYAGVAKSVAGFKVEPASAISATTTTIGSSAMQVDFGDEVDTAYAAVRNALQTIPGSRHIVISSLTDQGALGAMRALGTAHRTDVMIAGNGGEADAIAQLRKSPAWVAEASSFVPQWGEYFLAMSHALASGASVPASTPAPSAVLTKQNVDQYYAADGTDIKQLPPLNSGNSYLAATGVLQKFGNVSGLG